MGCNPRKHRVGILPWGARPPSPKACQASGQGKNCADLYPALGEHKVWVTSCGCKAPRPSWREGSPHLWLLPKLYLKHQAAWMNFPKLSYHRGSLPSPS